MTCLSAYPRVLLPLALLALVSVAQAMVEDATSFPGWLGPTMPVSSSIGTDAEQAKRDAIHSFDWSRVVQLSEEKPRAYLYKGFLSESECDHLVNKARPRFARSETVDERGNSFADSDRSSSGASFKLGEDDIIEGIERRISKWTFLPYVNQEPMQVLQYLKGQHYIPHVDFFLDKENQELGGNRHITVLMYLSNLKFGGETVFTEVANKTEQVGDWSVCAKGKLAMKPQKGDALMFFDVLPGGTPDVYSMHSACPVIEGEKLVAPKWIHFGNFMTPFMKLKQNSGAGEA